MKTKLLEQRMPTVVKVIAVLGYIGAALQALGGLGMLFGGQGMMGAGMMGYGTGMGTFGAFGGMLMGFGGIALLVMAAVMFFVSQGLGTGENWARIVVTVLAVIGAVQALAAMMQGGGGQVLNLVIQGAIAYYLWFNKDVRHAFGEAR